MKNLKDLKQFEISRDVQKNIMAGKMLNCKRTGPNSGGEAVYSFNAPENVAQAWANAWESLGYVTVCTESSNPNVYGGYIS